MEKIQQSVLQTMRSNALMNELIVVSAECDVGIEEYVKEKALAVMKEKHLYSPLEENVLMLEYPSPKAETARARAMFFDSAAIKAKNAVFEGCFAIDITEYADCLDDPKFDELMYYIKQNPQAVYCLVVHTKNVQVAERIFNFVSQSGIFIMSSFEIPDAQRLTDYTSSLIREFVPHINPDVTQALIELYSKNEYGYDFAEYLAQMLKNKKYKGDKDELLKAVEQLQKINRFNPSEVSYGY